MSLTSSVDALKEHLAPNREVILLSVCEDGTCRPLLCDEDLKAAVATPGAARFEVREVMRPQPMSRPSASLSAQVPKEGSFAATMGQGSAPSKRPEKRTSRKVAFGGTDFAEPLPTSESPDTPEPELLEGSLVEEVNDPFEDFVEETTNLVEVMGLQSDYRRLRSRLRKQMDFVWKTLQEHREVVSLVGSSARTMGTQNRMKVHSRDLAKLRHTVGLMEELKATADESLLQKPVEARWWIPHARQRLSQEDYSTGSFRRKPRRRCWESSWQSLGPFASVAFRFYASGDGDAIEGNSVIFLWMETPPIFSFSYTLWVGSQTVATFERWPYEAAWSRVEVPWALVDLELTQLENSMAPSPRHALPVRLRLVQWQGDRGP